MQKKCTVNGNRHIGARWRQENQEKVWSERLKQSRDTDEWRSSDDRVFQASGPDVENAWGPDVTDCILGTRSWLSSAEWRGERPDTEAVSTQSLER